CDCAPARAARGRGGRRSGGRGARDGDRRAGVERGAAVAEEGCSACLSVVPDFARSCCCLRSAVRLPPQYHRRPRILPAPPFPPPPFPITARTSRPATVPRTRVVRRDRK